MNTVNQCQGCQAGWPIITRTFPFGRHVEFHVVIGGYDGERCSCTKHLYESDSEVIQANEPTILSNTTTKP